MAYTRLNPSSQLQKPGPHPGKTLVLLKALRLMVVIWPLSTGIGAVQADAGSRHAESSDVMHLGAASCASSLCHGSVQPFEQSPILQNEFIIWQSDRYRNMHAKAFHKLQTKEAGFIARKLGIGPAFEAPECLSCHADLVSPERHGERFQLSDGVNCESCHGAAGQYIDLHTDPDNKLEDLVSYGLYPSWNPEARARLCLSCHLGDAERIINHRILGAGHPRLSFELDTFTFLQPHHVIDQDCVARKGQVDFVRDWALGQALSAMQSLNWLLDREIGWHGIFVEPALLDCHSCHQRLDSERWKSRGSAGLGPGEMRLNDANLIMLRLIMMPSQPEMAGRLRDGTRALHRATTIGHQDVLEAATSLKLELEAAVSALATQRFAIGDLVSILRELDREAVAGEFKDYVAAEQAAMAIVNLVLAFERGGMLEKEAVRSDLDRLFAVVADEYDYSDRELVTAIEALINHIAG